MNFETISRSTIMGFMENFINAKYQIEIIRQKRSQNLIKVQLFPYKKIKMGELPDSVENKMRVQAA